MAQRKDGSVAKDDLDSLQKVLTGDIATVKSELKSDISAVKSELKGDIATVKSELKSDISAVKSELKGDISAVKSELKGDISAVKSELKGDISKLAAAVVRADAKADRVKAELLAMMERHTSRILDSIDAFAKKGETYDRKAVTHGAMLVEHTDALRDHGRRLTSLEAKS
ncbi:MAG: hypothetical protein HY928_15595 [Elusimicrobia bacterium]|nr:hypothetical protein [Elusimicrobiota bacterium]